MKLDFLDRFKSADKGPNLPNGSRRLSGKAAFFGAAALAALAACSESRSIEGGFPPVGPTQDAGVTDTFAPDLTPQIDTLAPDVSGFVDLGVPTGDSGTADRGFRTCSPGGTDDFDGDTLCNDDDGCPFTFDDINPLTGRAVDADSDNVPDSCDNCRTTPNRDQANRDGDSLGDVCDSAPDTPSSGSDRDRDGVDDSLDNCALPNPAQTDIDRDGWGLPCDCDDTNAAINPGVAADTECDGFDADCNNVGAIIAAFPDRRVVIQGEPNCECIPGDPRTVGSNIGECRQGVERCEPSILGGSEFVATTPAVLTVAEVCNGRDDDCDGTTDEGLGGACECPTVGATQPCGIDVGDCSRGLQTCGADHRFSACAGGVTPAAEICDGADNDCDASIDEGFNIGASCIGTGACATAGAGVRECASPTTTRCSVNPGGSADRSTEELCDGADNDCDGTPDDGLFGGVAVGVSCNLPGTCGLGITQCNGPRLTSCSSASFRTNPPGENEGGSQCDGLDNDCDGAVDDGCTCRNGETRPCGTPTGECDTGMQTCASGVWGSCTGSRGPVAETCNGLDDDCDSSTDEGFLPAPGTSCRGLGGCGGTDIAPLTGVRECAPTGTATRCSTVEGSDSRVRPETCDGLDNDCDGGTDELGGGSLISGTAQVGSLCTPQPTCPAGTSPTRPSLVTCNGPFNTRCEQPSCSPVTP